MVSIDEETGQHVVRIKVASCTNKKVKCSATGNEYNLPVTAGIVIQSRVGLPGRPNLGGTPVDQNMYVVMGLGVCPSMKGKTVLAAIQLDTTGCIWKAYVPLVWKTMFVFNVTPSMLVGWICSETLKENLARSYQVTITETLMAKVRHAGRNLFTQFGSTQVLTPEQLLTQRSNWSWRADQPQAICRKRRLSRVADTYPLR